MTSHSVAPSVTSTFAQRARAANCWFDVDHVPRDPAATAWKRMARWRQASWRERRGYPMGATPYSGGDAAKPVGSRIALEFAKSTGANFLTAGALAAARNRLGSPEAHQTLLVDRLWADLLSSMPLCFNVVGDLSLEEGNAARAAVVWWPTAPRGNTTIRFEHSPGRRDRLFLGNRTAFDVAFDIDAGGGSSALIGIEMKYHEHTKAEEAPRPSALARYLEVTERSGAFVEGWRHRVIGTELQQIWLDHLLALSMLQHPSGRWSWVRFVMVYPSENPSFARAAANYQTLLRDAATFEARTLEELISTPMALAPATASALRDRYLTG